MGTYALHPFYSVHALTSCTRMWGLVGSIDPVLGGLAGVLLGAFIGFFFRTPEPKSGRTERRL
jgi:hypothetical protein